MRGVGVLVRAILGVAIVAGGVSGAILPAYADPAVAPGVPTWVVTTGASPTSMHVSWNAPSDDGGAAISDYTIEYRKVGELSWSTFAHTADPSTFATVTGLTRASTYAFRVAAVNSVDTGPWSVEQITADVGNDHSCAVMVNGTVKCWGHNNYGQLGNNTTTDSLTPVPVSDIDGLSLDMTAVSVSSGFGQTCALMADGTVQCWGANRYGQLGDNSSGDSLVPVSVSGIDGLTPGTTAVNVTTGNYHSCALMADGTVQCWGWNAMGQLGDSTNVNSDVPVVVTGIDGLSAATTAVSVSTGATHSCAPMASGIVRCWGDNNAGQLGDGSLISSSVPVSVSDITGLAPASSSVSVTSGAVHSCALMADGTVQCWGSNWAGQLGNNSTLSSFVPTSVSDISGLSIASTAVSVTAGGAHSCAVMANGTVRCWGYNDDGQLGDNSTTGGLVPVPVSDISGDSVSAATTAVGVSAGGAHSCAVLVNGTLQCWGSNGLGQLGNDPSTSSLVPVPVSSISGLSLDTQVAISAPTGLTLAVVPSAPTRVVTSEATSTSMRVSWAAPASDGGAAITDYAIQYRKVGELSWSEFTHAASSATTVTVTGLSTGSTYTFRIAAVNRAGTSGWSEQESTMDAGALHSCAVIADGAVTCWGNNDHGQLGNNSTTYSPAPGQVFDITGADAGTTAVSVSAAGNHSCAVLANGIVKCWGWNVAGQLGNNSTTNSHVPVLVSGITGTDAATTAVSVSAGDAHSCAVMANGTVICWGRNNNGQLGNNSPTDSPVSAPVQVSGITGADAASTAVSVSAGNKQTCAVMADGTITCWGYNLYGQLGNNSTSESPVPVRVSIITGAGAGTTAVSVSTGDYHSCAVMADGTVTCWGYNGDGQLGNNSTTNSPVPVTVPSITGADAATSAVSVSAGDSFSCATMANGTAQCWGMNTYGKLGNNSTTNSPVPVSVSDFTGADESSTALGVSSGAYHSCALMANDTIRCWGYNGVGQLGNGTNIDSLVTVQVSGITGLSEATRVAPGSSGSTLAGAPSAPTRVVTSEATSTSMRVSWSAPENDGGAAISDYTIQYRKVGELTWSTFAHAATTSTTATVIGLVADSTYLFRIAAVNSTGVSAWSAQGTTIANGSNHSCALMANGTVKCWGANGTGQLGNNSTTRSRTPVSVSEIDGSSPASTAVSVTAGYAHSCALMANGAVECWGYNFNGQLGDHSTTDSLTPVPIPDIDGSSPASTALSVAAGGNSTCAMMGDGTLKCWGNNTTGKLGDGTTTSSAVPVLVSGITGTTPASTAVSMSVGVDHVCAVIANGEVRCWGNNHYGQLGNNAFGDPSSLPVTVVDEFLAVVSTAVSVAVSDNTSCAVMENGTVRCWGFGGDGELGNGTITTSSPVAVSVVGLDGLTPATTVLSVSAGGYHTCALLKDGGVRCWGYNGNGQLGNASTTSSSVPVEVSGIAGGEAASVSAGNNSSCALLPDGTVQCWGANGDGQLGNASTTSSSVPVTVSGITGLSAATRVAVASPTSRTLAVMAPGVPTRVVTSEATSTSMRVSWSAPASNGGAAITDYTIQYRKIGELTWSTFTDAVSTATTATVTGLRAGSAYVFRVAAVNTAGTSGWSGQESTLDAGTYFSCAVMSDGTVRCWGGNSWGQLGISPSDSSLVPVPVSGITGTDALGASASTTATSVSAGYGHACALMADGTVKCWGLNNNGQLGDNSTLNSSVPVTVSGITGATPASTAVSVSAGGYHSCAVMADGRVKCWGFNVWGGLGDGTGAGSAIPVLVSDIDGFSESSTAVSVSAGIFHTCAVMGDSTVRCWGFNNVGQLGNDSTTNSLVPVPVSGIDGQSASEAAVSVSADGSESCALMADGTVQCWGYNDVGQLGNNSTTNSSIPVRVWAISGLTSGTTAVSVSTSGTHACAVMSDHSLQCWGSNGNGQLGIGTTTQRNVPVAVSYITGSIAATSAMSVSAGGYHTCAVMAAGTLGCWGANAAGQIGNNTTNEALTPDSVHVINGVSAATRVAVASPTGRTLEAVAPGAPGRPVIVKRTTKTVKISWSAGTNGGAPIQDYVVQYRLASARTWVTWTHRVSTKTSAVVGGLTKGATYVFRVKAVTAAGTGSASRVSTKALAAGLPGRIKSIVGKSTKTPGQLLVTWKAIALNGAPRAIYRVSVLVAGKWSKAVKPKSPSCLFKRLKPGTYSVKITATTVEGSTSAIKAGIKLLK